MASLAALFQRPFARCHASMSFWLTVTPSPLSHSPQAPGRCPSMLTFTEAQVLAWVSPLLWPFLRVLALFGAMPVLAQRSVPMRLRVALAFLIALCAQASLPEMPVIALDSAQAFLVVIQQLLIGLSLGFAVRIVFAAIELAGELVGLQMGLNFAGFFDPATGGQTTAVSRFYGVSVSSCSS